MGPDWKSTGESGWLTHCFYKTCRTMGIPWPTCLGFRTIQIINVSVSDSRIQNIHSLELAPNICLDSWFHLKVFQVVGFESIPTLTITYGILQVCSNMWYPLSPALASDFPLGLSRTRCSKAEWPTVKDIWSRSYHCMRMCLMKSCPSDIKYNLRKAAQKWTHPQLIKGVQGYV